MTSPPSVQARTSSTTSAAPPPTATYGPLPWASPPPAASSTRISSRSYVLGVGGTWSPTTRRQQPGVTDLVNHYAWNNDAVAGPNRTTRPSWLARGRGHRGRPDRGTRPTGTPPSGWPTGAAKNAGIFLVLVGGRRDPIPACLTSSTRYATGGSLGALRNSFYNSSAAGGSLHLRPADLVTVNDEQQAAGTSSASPVTGGTGGPASPRATASMAPPGAGFLPWHRRAAPPPRA